MLVEVSGRAVSRAYRRSGSSSNTATHQHQHQHQHQPKHLGVSCLSQVSSESRLSSRSSWSRRNRAALCRKVLGQGLTTDDPSWGSNTSRGDSRVSVWSPSSWPYIRSRSVPRYTSPAFFLMHTCSMNEVSKKGKKKKIRSVVRPLPRRKRRGGIEPPDHSRSHSVV